jgi:hypothetical protein
MEQPDMSEHELMAVEVVYALPEQQRLVRLTVPVGTSARQALKLSGLAEIFPRLDVEQCPVGVFGREVDSDFVLRDGDRVEVYRPLLNDPRERRRTLARRGQSMGTSYRESD